MTDPSWQAYYVDSSRYTQVTQGLAAAPWPGATTTNIYKSFVFWTPENNMNLYAALKTPTISTFLRVNDINDNQISSISGLSGSMTLMNTMVPNTYYIIDFGLATSQTTYIFQLQLNQYPTVFLYFPNSIQGVVLPGGWSYTIDQNGTVTISIPQGQVFTVGTNFLALGYFLNATQSGNMTVTSSNPVFLSFVQSFTTESSIEVALFPVQNVTIGVGGMTVTFSTGTGTGTFQNTFFSIRAIHTGPFFATAKETPKITDVTEELDNFKLPENFTCVQLRDPFGKSEKKSLKMSKILKLDKAKKMLEIEDKPKQHEQQVVASPKIVEIPKEVEVELEPYCEHEDQEMVEDEPKESQTTEVTTKPFYYLN